MSRRMTRLGGKAVILQALHNLYDRLADDPDYDIAPPGYSIQKISFVIVLEPDGRLFEIEDVRDRGGKRPIPRRVRVFGGAKPSGSGLNPCLLWDNAAYTLGYSGDPGKQARALESFAAFRDRHVQLEDKIQDSAFSAVCTFLRAWSPARCADFDILQEIESGFGVFAIRGATKYVHEREQIRQWWESSGQTIPAESRLTGQCLITGKPGETIARLHDNKIKGLAGVGGNSSGAMLVSFNADAFCSFRLDQSHNAPVSEMAANRYTSALNALLEGPQRDKHRKDLGDTAVTFWTEQPLVEESFFLAFATDGDEAITQDAAMLGLAGTFLDTVKRGGAPDRRPSEMGTRFWILGLGANNARVVVRFFLDGTLEDLALKLHAHYRDIEVARRFVDKEPAWPSPKYLIEAMQGEGESGKPPSIVLPALMEAILKGGRYPQMLYAGALRRIIATHKHKDTDTKVTHARACVIAGYLRRNLGMKEVPVSLDRERTDPAYRLGRLFAALAKAQNDALGGTLNTTVRDRFYGSASATPRSVFPRLLRTYQHHLAKLNSNYIDKIVQEILEPLDGFPAHLNLAEQGLFALGFYHQTQDFYRRKDTKATEPADTPDTERTTS